MSQIIDQSDDEIQAELAGEVLRGPLSFKGQKLHELSRGLRDLRSKVLAPDDTALFHDLALLTILEGAYAEDASARLEKRRALMASTDDVSGFRALVSLRLDGLTDAEEDEARRVTNRILGIVEKAEVSLAEKKSAEEAPVEPNPMTTLSTSGASPESPTGPPITSAGN